MIKVEGKAMLCRFLNQCSFALSIETHSVFDAEWHVIYEIDRNKNVIRPAGKCVSGRALGIGTQKSVLLSRVVPCLGIVSHTSGAYYSRS